MSGSDRHSVKAVPTGDTVAFTLIGNEWTTVVRASDIYFSLVPDVSYISDIFTDGTLLYARQETEGGG